jgi:hypothetical protein
MKKFFVATAIFFIAFQPIALGATSTNPAPAKPACRVDMNNSHISSRLLKKLQTVAVKANAKVICDKTIENLIVHINLYKSGTFGPILLKKFTSRTYLNVAANKQIKISGPIFVCLNWKPTEFFSTVSSDAIIEGEKMRAPWRKSYRIRIECGN